MPIEVRLFATLRKERGMKVLIEDMSNPTPRKIIKLLKIKPHEVAILLINGRDGELDYLLKDGDYLSIFPPVGGG